MSAPLPGHIHGGCRSGCSPTWCSPLIPSQSAPYPENNMSQSSLSHAQVLSSESTRPEDFVGPMNISINTSSQTILEDHMNSLAEEHQVIQDLTLEYGRLFFPEAGQIPTAGLQTSAGAYPNATEVSLVEHFGGSRTYAFDILMNSENDTQWCKFGVLDIDDIDHAADVAQNLILKARELGIQLVLAFSGGKGIHCYLFVADLVPKKAMVTVLKALQKAVPFKGDLIPGDNYRVKLPPCFHQKAQRVSYFLKDGELPEFLESTEQLKAILPEQLEILKSTQPMDTDCFMALSRSLGLDERPVDYAKYAPNIKSLPKGSKLPPCMDAFLKKGGAQALGTFDSQNLLLLNFCNSAGLDPDKAEKFAEAFARNTNPNISTTKSFKEKMRHWRSMQQAPSAFYDFSCLRILKGRSELGFDCSACPIRPEEVTINSGQGDAPSRRAEAVHSDDGNQDAIREIRRLPSNLSGLLISYLMSKGLVPSDIDEEIFPTCEDRAIFLALGHEKYNPTLIHAFLPLISDKKFREWESLGLISGKIEEMRVELERNCDRRLDALRGVAASISEKELDDLLALARELTLRARTRVAAHRTIELLEENAAAPVVLEFADATIKDLLRFDRGNVESQQAHLAELLNFLENSGQRISTGISSLDRILGGGFPGGSLATLCSPPGGGKTTLAGQFADNVASTGTPVLFVSMEMSRNTLGVRTLSRMSGIDSKILEQGTESWGDYADRITTHIEHYADLLSPNLYVHDEGGAVTPAAIRTYISTVRAKSGTPDDVPIFVVIDYLQLLQTGIPSIDNAPNETVKVTELASRVSRLAKDANVVILAISEATKEEQSNADGAKGMTMAAMRGSGRIAHCVDYALMLYSGQREKDNASDQDLWTPIKFLDGKPVSEQLAKLRKTSIVSSLEGYPVLSRLEFAKNRFGIKGAMIPLVYQKAFHRFISPLDGGQSC
ncbi:MAG: hypothetical protein EOM37_10445 [Proteobacteria bacterium]|nr:hypothetical protein [Pseudomonadota bacterium]